MFNQPSLVTEKTSTQTLRTTTTTYDSAERPLTTSILGPAGTGVAVPTKRNVYDAATGQLTNTQSLDGNNNVTAQTAIAYDALGRVVSYTDSDGNQSTMSYDRMSRATTVSDGVQSSTTAYDTGGEQRGLPTQVVDGEAGTITGTYDPDGNLVAEAWPNGVVVSHTYDEDGTQIGISYTRPGCGQTDCTLYTQTATVNASDNVYSYTSTLSAQQYGYDAGGRLTTVQDVRSGQCITRTYGFGSTAAGKASDRTSFTSYDPAADGSCQTAISATSAAWTYDSADRNIDSGYVYDSLGRATAVPAADTQSPDSGSLSITYNVNDLVNSIQQGANAATVYKLDVDNVRIRSWVDSEGVTYTNHYIDVGDSPAWTTASTGNRSRNIKGLTNMIATSASGNVSWLLVDLHGDIVESTTDGLAVAGQSEADEYGNLCDTAQVGTLRYGWLGDKQRAADNQAGIVLMGMRLYNPVTGRFLSMDPVLGGSANKYDYAWQDPVNQFDTSGKYAYHYTYFVGVYFHTATSTMSWVATHFDDVFPFYNTPHTIRVGQVINLDYFNPVRVISITNTGFYLYSLPGHSEGPDKTIHFWFSESWGWTTLHVQAWGPDNTWCNRNWACAIANKQFALVTWFKFALNIDWELPYWW